MASAVAMGGGINPLQGGPPQSMGRARDPLQPGSPPKMEQASMKKEMKPELIAPCGMNCRLCLGFVRDKNTCPGCRIVMATETKKSGSRKSCIIRECEILADKKLKFCGPKCDKYPCRRLKNLDKRYRTRYGMSMLDNLAMIENEGVRAFIRSEKARWKCPECGEYFCVHRPACLECGTNR